LTKLSKLRGKAASLCVLAVVVAGELFSGTSHVALAQSVDRDKPIKVSVQTLRELAVAQRQSATATVVSANRAIVAAEVAAQITSISADVGSQVEKDQELARLDTLDYELALAQAEAQLKATDAQIELAQRRLERATELSGSQFISADDVLARQTDVAVFTANRLSQQIAVRIAKRNLNKTRVRAPFAASVVARPAQQGSFAVAGSPLFELVQLDGREVEADVATDLIDGLRNGTDIRYERNGQSFATKLLRVSPVADSGSGTQLVRLAFTADPAVIGSSGRLTWSGTGQQLGPGYLSRRNSKLGVFVVEQNRARFHPLPAAQEGRAFTINLDDDTQIVTVGRTKLQSGQALTIVKN